MLTCKKCYGRILVDRVFSSETHLETYCINCGSRNMYHHPESHGKEGKWLMDAEIRWAKENITPM